MTKRSEQTVIMLSKEEKELVERLAEKMKGTNSQVFRLALSKLNEEIKRSENQK